MQRTGIFIGITVVVLLIQDAAKSQVVTDKPSFIKKLIAVFEKRNNGFDSIAGKSLAGSKGRETTIKLPGADECYINYGSYTARYSFSDSAKAISFFKELQSLISEAATAYSARARFLPDNKNPYYLPFHLSDDKSFLWKSDLVTLREEVGYGGFREKGGIPRHGTSNPPTNPFVLYLILDGQDNALAGFTSQGNRLNDPEISALVKDVALGQDYSMSLIKKNKKTVGDEVTYESKRTLKGYKATIYENVDEETTENVLYLLKQWKGKKDEEVLKKADSLISFVKGALPDAYSYIINSAEQTITFNQHPFTTQQYDASLTITYGLSDGVANSYYVALAISRIREASAKAPAKEKEKALIPFKEGSRFGYKNDNREIVVSPRYDEAASFYEGRGMVVLNKRYGYIDANGKEVIPLKYDYASLYFFGGTAEFRIGNKWGMLNKDGKEIIPAKYDAIDRNRKENENRFLRVKLNGKYGFVDSSDREVIPIKYEQAEFWLADYAKVKLNNLWGLIDRTGKIIVPLSYDYLHTSDTKDNTFISPRQNKKYGLMDKTGKLLIPIKYDQVSIGFQENFCRVELDGRFGFLDKKGKEVIPLKFENTSDFVNGTAAVKLNGKWGFIDKTGKEIIACKYSSTKEFSNGLAPVELNGKWGYIDKMGKVVVPFQYDNAWAFETNGKARVYIGNKWGQINVKGQVVDPIVNVTSDDDDDW